MGQPARQEIAAGAVGHEREIAVCSGAWQRCGCRDGRKVNTLIIGDLGRRWEVSPDGLSYTFSLYEARWWDGQPVTAVDVKFSLDQMLETGQPRPRVGALRHYIERVDVIDLKTVKVHTKFPRPAALLPWLAVDYAVIYPKHVLETGADFDDPRNIVGSGPFKLKNYQRGQSWELVKNPEYFKKGLPFLDGIQTFITKDNHETLKAFQTGRVLMCNRNGSCGLSATHHLDLEQAMQGKGVFHWQEATLATGINLNVTKPPFDDPRVRRAIYLAIDRQDVIRAMALGRGTGGSPFFPNTWMSSPMDENRWLFAKVFRRPCKKAIRESLYAQPEDQSHAAYAYKAFSVAMLCSASWTLPAATLRSSTRGRAADGLSAERQANGAASGGCRSLPSSRSAHASKCRHPI